MAGEDFAAAGFEVGEGTVVFDDVGGEGGFLGHGPLAGDAGEGFVFGQAPAEQAPEHGVTGGGEAEDGRPSASGHHSALKEQRYGGGPGNAAAAYGDGEAASGFQDGGVGDGVQAGEGGFVGEHDFAEAAAVDAAVVARDAGTESAEEFLDGGSAGGEQGVGFLVGIPDFGTPAAEEFAYGGFPAGDAAGDDEVYEKYPWLR